VLSLIEQHPTATILIAADVDQGRAGRSSLETQFVEALEFVLQRFPNSVIIPAPPSAPENRTLVKRFEKMKSYFLVKLLQSLWLEFLSPNCEANGVN
jgi:hypothetical protein